MAALLGMPVRGTGDIQGILFLVESRRPRRWQDKEIRLLLNYTNRAGVAWENAYLHKQLEWAAALQERQRIAAEMHDGLAQTISTLALRNDQASQMVEEGRLNTALDELAAIQGIISVAGGDLRRSIASLRQDPQPRCSLQDALAGLTQNNLNGYSSQFSFHSTIAAPLHLPPSQFDQIVSLVQEALLNAQKHAAAKRISIQLAELETGYQVVIQDDGCGFDVASVADQSGNHFGLSIMRARAEHLGGELVIKSAPGSGTRILLSWPDSTAFAGGTKTGHESVMHEPVLLDFIQNRKRQIWQK
jgi:signal transduction histidine kinase